MIALDDAETLNNIEKIVNQFMDQVYDQALSEETKRISGVYHMGMITATLIRRNKDAD